MAKQTSPKVSEIVLPASKNVAQRVPATFVARPIPRPISFQETWAPAWFYSALNWLGKSYQDAGNVPQRFGLNLVGSDVDPYRQLGSTRLFVISLVRDTMFRLSVARDASSLAPLPAEGTLYPNTDAGITDLYTALSQSSIFSAVNYCYVPGQLGTDLSPVYASLASGAASLSSGYDPATGLRAIVLGSAVSQAVPLDNFLTIPYAASRDANKRNRRFSSSAARTFTCGIEPMRAGRHDSADADLRAARPPSPATASHITTIHSVRVGPFSDVSRLVSLCLMNRVGPTSFMPSTRSPAFTPAWRHDLPECRS